MHAALLTLAVAVIAAPVPKEKGKELYFPVLKGTKWVSVSKSGDTSRERVETVTAVEEKGGVYAVTVDVTADRAPRVTWTFEVSAKGVFQKAINGKEPKEPIPLLKAGSKEGDTWTAEVRVPGGQGTQTFTVGKEEEVEVPAGKFQAIRIDSETTSDRGSVGKAARWYAPGVGVVKSVSTDGGRETTSELKEFTPGDGKPKAEPKTDK